jgi:hypothetical protein
MSASATFRVELRQPRRTKVLATLLVSRPHFRTLDPFVSHLLRDGHQGNLALVNAETGEVVVRRRVPKPARAIDRF